MKVSDLSSRKIGSRERESIVMKNLHRLVMNSLFLACVLCLIPAFPMPVFLADVHANQPEASYQEAVSGHIASESAAASDSAAASEKPLQP